MPIQGSAADVIKVAMLNLARAFKERGLKSQMTLQVHDELVLECPESEVDTVALLAREIMEHAYELDAKLLVDVSVGKNWDEMEKYG
jgi:DNA polymerase-1